MSDLYPTPARKALLRAIDDGHGRIYCEHNTVWDKALAWRCTAKVQELLRAQWIRALTPDEPRGPGEWKVRTYYRLTDAGKKILEGR